MQLDPLLNRENNMLRYACYILFILAIVCIFRTAQASIGLAVDGATTPTAYFGEQPKPAAASAVQSTTAASDTKTTASAAGFVMVVESADDVRRARGDEWYVMPGKRNLKIFMTTELRKKVRFVKVKNNWFDRGGPPRTITTIPFDSSLTDATGPLTVSFDTPLTGTYHVWAEAWDTAGHRYMTPTLVLQCVNSLPPKP